jgi:hypothetical protein
LCVLRARFFRLDVLRFGTAMGLVGKRRKREAGDQRDSPLSLRRDSQRGSAADDAH